MPIITELPQGQKLLLARGALLDSSRSQLDVLISLTTDPDQEVSSLAQETLDRLGDDHYAKLLSSTSLPEFVYRYFLDVAHFRPILLPVLLANTSVPEDAIVGLAAKAGADVLPAFLANLDLLKTSALEALKKNPAAADRRKAALAISLPSSREAKLAMAREEVKLPEGQRVELLVLLAADLDVEVQLAAQDTLRRIPDDEYVEGLTERYLPEPIARYFLDTTHVRPALLAVLLTRSDLPQDAVTALAGAAGSEILGVLLDQLDMLKTPALIALKDNPAYLDWQKSPPPDGIVLEVDLLEMLIQEVEAERLAPPETRKAAEQLQKTEGEEADVEEGTVSKIARMSVAKKVVLALRGNKEERAILIRDGSKVVSRAVLGSPKLTEAEVESFASLKNVSQDVLRLIAMNRKFVKDYIVVKNLANNPRLPIDVGLSLINHLMTNDVRALASNRDVSDTIRKMAHKLASTRAH